MNRKKGFTLIELLVVIAIIGILSSVVLTSLNSSRAKARIAAAQATLSGVVPAAVICTDDNADLVVAGGLPVAGTAVCSGSTSNWPALPSGWTYGTAADVDVSNGTFSFNASSTNDDKTVTCTETGCVVTDSQ